MARVLFINAGSEGHINPTIGVVRELVARGEEVVYFCVEAFRERMEQAGADVRTFDGQAFIQAFLSGGRNHVLERINGLLLTAEVVVPSVLEQIDGERFDYMIHDSMFGCGRLLAQLLQLPAVCSCTSFAQTEASFERMLAQLSSDVPAEALQPAYDEFERLTAAAMEAYGVEIRSPYEVFCNPAPLTLVYTTRAFQPGGDRFGPSYKFVGPSIAPRPAGGGFDAASIEGKGLIYISLGTVFNRAIEFYKLCFEAFGSTEYRAVLSIGTKVHPSELGNIPENFIVEQYVPQTELLKHAKLFITHGGMNSAHEGLYYGVPLLVIPQGEDQPVVAGQVAKLGAGMTLDMPSLTAGQLRDAAEHVLHHASYKQAAEAMRNSLRSSGGYRQAADEIFEWNRRRQI